MGVQVFGLKNCDTCRKARKWLERNSVKHEFLDLRKSTPPVSTLKQWQEAVGDALLNRRGTTWRQLPEIEKAKAGMKAELPALLHVHPALMKRPILVVDDEVHVGFNDATWRKLLNMNI